mmetsp:Transcript_100702/g.291071  ORF Transcript_100702/g.291071 Transcript_100702/m.291071 type:complete len:318 (-) Transcript_100702:919-1872(-)
MKRLAEPQDLRQPAAPAAPPQRRPWKTRPLSGRPPGLRRGPRWRRPWRRLRRPPLSPRPRRRALPPRARRASDPDPTTRGRRGSARGPPLRPHPGPSPGASFARRSAERPEGAAARAKPLSLQLGRRGRRAQRRRLPGELLWELPGELLAPVQAPALALGPANQHRRHRRPGSRPRAQMWAGLQRAGLLAAPLCWPPAARSRRPARGVRIRGSEWGSCGSTACRVGTRGGLRPQGEDRRVAAWQQEPRTRWTAPRTKLPGRCRPRGPLRECRAGGCPPRRACADAMPSAPRPRQPAPAPASVRLRRRRGSSAPSSER